MSDGRVTFGFVHTSQWGKHDLSIHFPNNSLLSRPSSFQPYPDLPFELRQNIRNIAIQDARLNQRQSKPKPKVMQSLRGIFKTRYTPGYPTLSSLACVDEEWQKDVEKILFNFLRLSHITICESPQGSDILEFANIVTGPRRRYLADLVIDLELVHECAEEGALYIQSGSLPPRACTVGFSACITQVFETLATWRDDEVRGGLIELMIELKVERKAYGATRELIGYDASLVDLPTVSVVSQLWFHPDTFQIEVSAYYVLALCRRLSQLRAVWTDLGPRCCSEETASTPCMEVLTQQIISAVPRLTDLQISALFWLHCPRHVSGAIPHLPRSSVESLRQLSYRLQELSLTPTDTCLRQFFSPFDRDDFDATSESIQSWPALRHLTLNGTFVYADGIAKTEQDQFNEGHLTCVGRATRFMPKLEYIWIHNQNHGEGEPYGELRFTFHTRPYGPKRDKSQGFCLSVENHMPSSTVVEIWRESLKHAQRETLAVEVHRGRVYDMNEMYDSQGPPPEEEWESWETSMSHPSVEVVPESIGMSSDEENAEA